MKTFITSILLATAAASTAQAAPPPAVSQTPATAPTRFSVVVEGEGADVLMIPGLMSHRSVWDGTVASLEGKYRTHRLQLGGFAGEPAGGNANSALLEPIVEQIAAYIRDKHLDRPAVVGHSMGGLIGLMLAERHPDLIGKVMIVDALPFYPMLMNPALTAEAVEPRAKQLRDTLAAMPDDAFRAQQEAGLASLVNSEAARPRLLDHSVTSDRAIAARAIYEVMTTDMRPKLAAVKVPLTIVYATNAFAPDATVEPLYRSYAAAPDARLVEVPDSYHFIMIDQPELFHSALSEFLGGKAQ